MAFIQSPTPMVIDEDEINPSPPDTPPPTLEDLERRPSVRLRTTFSDTFSFDHPPDDLKALFSPSQLDYIRQCTTHFQQMSPQQKQYFLREILDCCDTSQLAFVSNLVQPKLKIDFLKELPIEISLHILSFIDNPKYLSRAACVSSFWNSLVKDEEVWKWLCQKHQFKRRNSAITGGSLLEPPARRIKFSYRDYFKRRFNIESSWNNGGRSKCVPLSESGLVTSLQFDDEIIVVGCDNSKIEVFDTVTGRKTRTLEGHETGVWALQFLGGKADDRKRILVSGGCDRDVRVWDLDTGVCKHIMHGHTSTVRCLRMRDKKTAVSGSRDATLRVWDLEAGVQKHLLLGHQASVRCLDIHGDIAVSGSYDATARVWDLDTGACLAILQGHYSQIYAVAFDGEKIVTGSLDSNIRVWSPQGQCLSILQGHSSLVGQLQVRGSTLVSGGSDGCLRIWDLNTYECLHRRAAHDISVTCLQFDDKRIVTGGNDGQVKLWDAKSGQLIRSLLSNRSKTIWRLAFNDTKAVIVMQRESATEGEAGKTLMEIHNFDVEEC